jgi:hypothetical protein
MSKFVTIGEGNVDHYCLKHYNQSLQHQQGTEQPRSINPVNSHIIVSASSSIWQDELHLNQAIAQPNSKNPIDATTDNDGINGNIFNPSISIWHGESIGLKQQWNRTAVHLLSFFLPQLGKGFFLRP